jgi:predicted acylesterase/phospholipase RssA/CRP-like cAMP-binding protein
MSSDEQGNPPPVPEILLQSPGPVEGDLWNELLENLQFQTLNAGRNLFKQGDPAGAAYIVKSGRLRVAIEGKSEPEKIINEVGRGEMVGEMGLLADKPRSATVYAVRDTVLARLPRQEFFGLLEKHPWFLFGLTNTVVRRLQSQSVTDRPRTSPVSTIALVPTGPSVPIEEFANALRAAIEALGTAVLIADSDVDEGLGEQGLSQVPSTDSTSKRIASWIEQNEENYRYLILRAEEKWSYWTQRCARQADMVVFIGESAESPQLGIAEQYLANFWPGGRAPQRILALLHDAGEPFDTAKWLNGRQVDQHYHVYRGRENDYSRLARCITGAAVGVILGGGGARGLAHIGVLRAIEEAGIPIDYIGGTSIGAAIGAMYVLNRDSREVQKTWEKDFRSLRDYTWPLISLMRGKRLNQSIRNTLKDFQIEDLRLPYFAVSTNLSQSERHVSRRGGLFDAVRASVSLPGVFPPCLQETGDYHVDGGLVDSVPVEVMRSISGNGPLIAVDVSSKKGLAADPRIQSEVSGLKLLAKRLNPFTNDPGGPGIVSMLLRATEVSSAAARNRSKPLADLYLELSLDDFSLMDFSALDALANRGYELSIEHLRSWLERSTVDPASKSTINLRFSHTRQKG